MAKHHDVEYKNYVCRLVIEEGQKITELSKQLGISSRTISRWLKHYKNETGWAEQYIEEQKTQEQTEKLKEFYLTDSDLKKEHDALRKDYERLIRENQILKKAMHVFTENHE